MQIFSNYSTSLKDPSLIQIGSNLFVLSFHVMKLLPALYMLKQAQAAGKLDKNSLVVETSSGSFAYGIALACTELQLPFAIVTDHKIDPLIKEQIKGQKGTLFIVKNKPGNGGIQQARLNKLYEVLKTHPGSFWPCQYDNLDNQKSYHQLGGQLIQTLGKDLVLVGSVGSGGSTCGLISSMRQQNSEVGLVGVDTFGSVLFGMQDSPRILRGLGNSILPKNLDHTCFDEVHWVSGHLAFHATHELHALHGLFCGPTTGAAYKVAAWVSKHHPNQKVVFTSPDLGYRYLSSVYNKKWLKKQGFLEKPLQEHPTDVFHPQEARDHWSCFSWKRRRLDQV